MSERCAGTESLGRAEIKANQMLDWLLSDGCPETPRGLQPDPGKLAAIRLILPPISVKELRSTVVLACYARMSSGAGPLSSKRALSS